MSRSPIVMEMDFGDHDGAVVTVKSAWRGKGHSVECGTETEPLYYAEGEAQTHETKDSAAQTDELEVDELAAEELSFEGWRPSAAMANFLLKVAPAMNTQLERNAGSHAFDDFDVFAADESDQMDCLHTLSVAWVQPEGADAGDGFESKADSGSGEVKAQLPCTGLSWTATGSVLCASFGKLDHEGWCNHRAGLATWNVFSTKEPTKPDNTFETMSCLMCVACHPLRPSIVAAGTFNGEVVVWDMNKTDDPCIARSRIDDYFHREPVQRVEWMRDFGSRDHLLSSVSADGKVLFWSLANNLAYPVQGFRLVPPRGLRAHRSARSKESRSGDVIGGTALSFQKDGRFASSFIVASEGGGVYKCLIKGGASAASRAKLTGTEMTWSKEAQAAVKRVPLGDQRPIISSAERHARYEGAREVSMAVLYDAKPDAARLFPSPINFGYQPHTGPVHGIDCSPFHRNLFLTCGADGRLNLFSMLQTKPLTWFEPSSHYLFCAQWSRVRPLVLAAGDGEGVVHLFDLQQSLSAPVATLVDSSTKSSRRHGRRGGSAAAIYSLAFNPRWRNMIAVGDGAGRVFVWKLGWRLSNARPKEEQTLAGIVQSWEDEGVLLDDL